MSRAARTSPGLRRGAALAAVLRSVARPAAVCVIALGTVAAGTLGGAPAALAESSVGIDPQAPPPLGAAWDVEREIVRSAPGTCVRGTARESQATAGTRFSLLLLSRAGGRLVLGLHAVRLDGVEALGSPQVTDAARRLHRADPEAFRDLCGAAFVLGWLRGVDYAAELEVDRADAARAAAWLELQRGFGSWNEPGPLEELAEALLARYRLSARELPHGSRREARPVEAALAFERALALAEAPDGAVPVPLVAILGEYDTPALSGLPVPWSGALPDSVAAAVFSRGRRGGFSAAGR